MCFLSYGKSCIFSSLHGFPDRFAICKSVLFLAGFKQKKTVGVIAFDFSFKNVNLIIKEEVNNSRNLKAENIISSHQGEIIVNGLLLSEFLKEKLSVFPT